MIEPDTRNCVLGLIVGTFGGICLWTGAAIVAAWLGWLG